MRFHRKYPQYQGTFNLDLLFFIGVLIFATLIRIPYLHDPIDPDTGLFAAIGKSLLQGKVLFEDVIDNKPPAIFWTYSLLFKFFDYTEWTINLFILVMGVLASLLVFVWSKRVFNSTIAFISALIFAFFSASPFVEGTKGRTEIFLVVLTLISLYIATFGPTTKPSFFKHFLCGSIIGVGFLFKQIAIYDLGVLLFFILLRSLFQESNLRLRVIIYQCLFAVIGFLIPLALCMFYWAWHHQLENFIFCVFTFNIQYIDIMKTPWNQYLRNLYFENFALFYCLLPLGVGTLYYSAFTINRFLQNAKNNFRESFRSSYTELFLIFWLLLSFGAVCLSGRFFPYYYIITLPASCLMTGYLISSLFNQGSLWHTKFNKFTLAFIFIFCFGHTLIIHLDYFHYKMPFIRQLNMYPRQSFREAREVGHYINQNTSPDDYIYLWADDAEIALYADRKCSDKYFKNTPLAYFSEIFPDVEKDLMSSLLKHRPKYVVIDTQFGLSLEYYSKINRYFRENYHLEREFKVVRNNIVRYSFIICKRNDDTLKIPISN